MGIIRLPRRYFCDPDHFRPRLKKFFLKIRIVFDIMEYALYFLSHKAPLLMPWGGFLGNRLFRSRHHVYIARSQDFPVRRPCGFRGDVAYPARRDLDDEQSGWLLMSRIFSFLGIAIAGASCMGFVACGASVAARLGQAESPLMPMLGLFTFTLTFIVGHVLAYATVGPKNGDEA